jgi:CBS domain-containing protein
VRERIGCLPVVEGEHLVGLLSDTDCLRFLADLLRKGEEPS